MADVTPLRIGVTGSREFGGPALIAASLVAAHARARPHDGHILVHGQCDPRHPDTGRMIPWATARRVSWEVQRRYLGADWLAVQAALDMHDRIKWEIESHPADWEAPCRPWCRPGHRRRRGRGPEYCPAAGNYRNQVGIIDPGLDELLAFYKRGAANVGTSDCVRRAGRAGIKVEPCTA